MKTEFMIEKPQEIQATMKITMPIKKWEELRDQLNDNYPSWELSSKIADLLCQAREAFYPTIQDKETLPDKEGR